MTKAEEAALKAYPEKDCLNKKGTGRYDSNYPRRKAYIEGYEQTEKDTIERACEYLFKHYAINLDEFTKYMEEQP